METTLQVIEENFESQQSGKSDLLIHIGEENISYAIVDQGQEQLKALVEYKATISDLEAIMQADRYLNYFYRRIKITVNTLKYTFIPREVFSDSEIEDYSLFISAETPSEVLVNDIRPFKIKNVMAVDTHVRQIVASHFARPALFSQANPFIEGAFKIGNHTGGTQLCINIHPDMLEIACTKEGNLLFYNAFESNGPDDFNYFLLLVINQFELNSDNTRVTVAGKIEISDAVYERIGKYFQNITIADPRNFLKCLETFDEVNLHQYFSLISLNLCE